MHLTEEEILLQMQFVKCYQLCAKGVNECHESKDGVPSHRNLYAKVIMKTMNDVMDGTQKVKEGLEFLKWVLTKIMETRFPSLTK